MDQEKTKHQYRPLPPGPFIRVLHLQPGKRGDVIKCTTEIVSLKDKTVKYHAISYEWGDAHELHQVILDGVKVTVRNNLHTYLMDLRNNTKPMTVWADALCIDQDSKEEKNHQVQQMWEVYSNSSVTHVFLNTTVERLPFRSPWWYTTDQVWRRSRDIRAIWFATYWQRLWIIQEIMASPVVEVHVSSKLIVPWKILMAQGDELVRNKGRLLSSQESSELMHGLYYGMWSEAGLHELDFIRGSYASDGQSHRRLPWALLTTAFGKKRLCADIRDRVFGLNSLASCPVQIDYHVTSAQLACNVLNACSRDEVGVHELLNGLWVSLALRDVPLDELEPVKEVIWPVNFRSVHSNKTSHREWKLLRGASAEFTEVPENTMLVAPKWNNSGLYLVVEWPTLPQNQIPPSMSSLVGIAVWIGHRDIDNIRKRWISASESLDEAQIKVSSGSFGGEYVIEMSFGLYHTIRHIDVVEEIT